MRIAPLPTDEVERLRTLHELRILDTAPEPAFDALARLAAQLIGVPVGLLTLLDEDRNWFKAAIGTTLLESPRAISFCSHAILEDTVFVVDDTLLDPRFADSPLVVAPPGIRFYASAPIHVDGHRVGTLCTMDLAPHHVDDASREALRDLATAAEALLQARLREQRWRLEAARVRTASRAASDWLWETDAERRVTWMTDGVEAHTGIPAKEEIGQQALGYNFPRDDEYRASWDAYLVARARLEPFTDTVVERDTPKGRITVSMSGVPVFDSAGVFRGYRGASRNITAEVQARAQARRAENLLQQALESFVAGVMISASDGRILLANACWRQRSEPHGAEGADTWPEQLCRQVRAGFYPEALGREEAFIAWRLALPSRDATQHELRFRDGWLLVSERHLADGGVVHFALDITDRKRAELALVQSEAQLRDSQHRLDAVLSAVPDLWFVVDDEGRYLEVSRPDHPSLTIPWEQMRGRLFGEVVPPEHTQQVEAALQRARAEGEPQRIEYALETLDGSPRVFEARLAPMPTGQWLYLTRDITEQRRAEQAMRDKQNAELTSRTKSEFLSRMSHELRTPLNAVLGFAQLIALRAGDASSEEARYANHILQAGNHLLALVDDVLDLQQVEEGRFSLNLGAVDLAEAVKGTVELLGPLAAERGIVTRTTIAAGLRVRADPQRLRQVLINLASNAIKYNRPAGQIEWTAKPGKAGRLLLQIADTGHGMSADQQARLFQPFERLGKEASSIEGTGLGLVIARRLVQEMGGALSIRSRPGRGTKVLVELLRPAELDAATLAPAGSAQVPAAEHARDAAGRLRLLYVEDNRVNAILFEAAMRLRSDIDLRVVPDGRAALDMARRWLPGVLVLDAHLPDIAGSDLLTRLRELPGLQSAPAFMCSADAMPDDLQRARHAGFAGYWTKPIDVQRLLADLDRVMSTPRHTTD